MTYLAILIALFGSCFGSFLALVAYRYYRDENFSLRDVFVGRSRCESCGNELDGISLIPVVGWLVRLGRCKYCKAWISPLYPLGEAFLGISFLLLYQHGAPALSYIVLSFLYFLAFCDIFSNSVPKKVVDLFVLAAVIYFLAQTYLNYLESPIGWINEAKSTFGWALLVVGVPALINRVRVSFGARASFGTGDLLILFGLGLLSKYDQIIYTALFTILLAGGYAILMVLLRRLTLKSYIPLVPFIGLAWLTVQILL